MPLAIPYLAPMLAGGFGFLAGSWTSDLFGKLLKMAALAAGVFLFYELKVK